MSAAQLNEYFLTQPEIYGYRVASFLSFTADSIFYVTPGNVRPNRRLLAVFSYIVRDAGYLNMLGLEPVDYLQHGYAKLEVTDEDEEWLISHKRKKGYSSITYLEY